MTIRKFAKNLTLCTLLAASTFATGCATKSGFKYKGAGVIFEGEAEHYVTQGLLWDSHREGRDIPMRIRSEEFMRTRFPVVNRNIEKGKYQIITEEEGLRFQTAALRLLQKQVSPEYEQVYQEEAFEELTEWD